MRTFISFATVATMAVLVLASCKGNDTKTNTETTLQDSSTISTNKNTALKPTGPAPEWAPSIKPEMLVVIEKLISLGGKPIETLTAVEARKQPTPTDAVMAIMQEKNIAMPAPLCDTMGKDMADSSF